MFVLQKTINGVISFEPFELLSDLFQELRFNNGLDENEFFELLQLGGFERPGLYLCWFQGEVPTGDALAARLSAAVRK